MSKSLGTKNRLLSRIDSSLKLSPPIKDKKLRSAVHFRRNSLPSITPRREDPNLALNAAFDITSDELSNSSVQSELHATF